MFQNLMLELEYFYASVLVRVFLNMILIFYIDFAYNTFTGLTAMRYI